MYIWRKRVQAEGTACAKLLSKERTWQEETLEARAAGREGWRKRKVSEARWVMLLTTTHVAVPQLSPSYRWGN